MLKVRTMKTDRLVPYEGNAKMHTPLQIEQIAKSIEEFGFNDPIAFWKDPDGRNIVVEGHGRLLAAKKLGLEEVPVIDLSSLTDSQRRAYTHIHNQLTMNSGLDYEVLAADIADLTEIDWKGLGFDFVDLASDSGSAVFEPEDFSYLDPDPVADAFVCTVRCSTQEEKDALASLLGEESLRRMYVVGDL